MEYRHWCFRGNPRRTNAIVRRHTRFVTSRFTYLGAMKAGKGAAPWRKGLKTAGEKGEVRECKRRVPGGLEWLLLQVWIEVLSALCSNPQSVQH